MLVGVRKEIHDQMNLEISRLNKINKVFTIVVIVFTLGLLRIFKQPLWIHKRHMNEVLQFTSSGLFGT